MAAPIKIGYRLPQEHYAYIYAVHPNTVSRWQQRRLPLDEPRKLVWLVARHPSCPASLKAKGAAAIQADYELLAQE